MPNRRSKRWPRSSPGTSARPETGNGMPSMLTGIPASPGIVVGPVYLLRWAAPEIPMRVIDGREIRMRGTGDRNPPHDLARLHDACATAIERLRTVRERGERHAGRAEAAI